jgi:DNA-binding CsgD family transcriptional regulator
VPDEWPEPARGRDDLDITLNTARAHLSSIFAKTGIDRQARLVRAILRSVAALG